MIKIHKLINSIHQKNVSVTPIRYAILNLLSEKNRPLTASQIAQNLADNGLKCHRATIYRDIDFFVNLDIIRPLAIRGESAQLYELWTDEKHHHFKCQDCGKIFEFKDVESEKFLDDFARKVAKKNKWKIKAKSFKLYGLCQKCMKNVNKN